MSRNASGVYTLPAGNPVVSGTVVSSTVRNTTMNDLADALTDSLSRTGKGGMTSPLLLPDGGSSLPALSFSADPNMGVYRAGANILAMSIAGVQRLRATSAGVVVTGTGEITGNATVGGTLGVTGASTLASVGVTGNATVGGTLGVTGASTLASVGVTGNATVGGTLGVTGASTLASVGVTGNATVGGTLGVTGVGTFSSNVTVAGSVGIGTTDLDELLTVNGNIQFAESISTSTPNSESIALVTGAQTSVGSVNTTLGFHAPDAHFVASTIRSAAHSGTSDSAENYGGNLLLAAGEALTNHTFNAWTRSEGGALILRSGAAYNSAGSGNVRHTYAQGEIIFQTPTAASATDSTYTERMRLDKDGFFGIGTSSPSQRLHVHNPATGAGSLAYFTNGDSGTSSNGGLLFGVAAGASTYVRNRANTELSLWTNDIRRVTVTADGHVNQGTSVGVQNYAQPTFMIGDGSAGLVTGFSQPAGTGSNTVAGGDLIIRVGVGTGAGANGDIIFQGAGSGVLGNQAPHSTAERMRIKSGGNVGIGTDSPGAKLQVNGTVRGQDAVFSDNGTYTVTSPGVLALRDSGDVPYISFHDNGGTRDSLIVSRDTEFKMQSIAGYCTFHTVNTEEMRLTTGGDLLVGGNVVAYSTTISDLRHKEDLRTITAPEAKLGFLNGYNFRWKESGQWDVGLIAQEVETVLPHAVQEVETLGKGKSKVLNPYGVTGLLVEVGKAHTQRLNDIERRLAAAGF